jgi:hypothetical protein
MKSDDTTVHQWDRFSIGLTGPDSDSMYDDDTLIARFRHGNREVQVRGFYDGDGRFEVRFMPDSVGPWSYQVSASFLTVEVTGEFECIGPRKGVHGPVRTNGTRLTHTDGTEYLPFGTTCYAWVHQALELQEQTLRTLKDSPFNKLRMCVFPKHYLYNENEPLLPVVGRSASGELDFSRFNPDFFALLEKRIIELGELGIEADLILFHGYDRWGYARMSPEQDDRYLRYIVARLASFRNVWWSLANEYDLMTAKNMSDWDRFFRIIQTEDPSQHLRSIHNCHEFYDHGKPWVTHCSIQHEDTSRVSGWLKRYRKPIVIDECRYEGNIHTSWGSLSAEAMVHKFWDTVCRGGYGGHGETYVDPDDVLWWSKGGVLHGKSPARIGFLRSIVQDAPSQKWGPLGSRGDWAAIGVEGEYMLTYFGQNQPSYWPLELPENAEYHLDVIDAQAMMITPIAKTLSGRCTVDLPGKPYCALRVIRRA